MTSIEEVRNKLQNIENELLRVEMQHGHICRMLLQAKKKLEKLEKETKKGETNV